MIYPIGAACHCKNIIEEQIEFVAVESSWSISIVSGEHLVDILF